GLVGAFDLGGAGADERVVEAAARRAGDEQRPGAIDAADVTASVQAAQIAVVLALALRQLEVLGIHLGPGEVGGDLARRRLSAPCQGCQHAKGSPTQPMSHGSALRPGKCSSLSYQALLICAPRTIRFVSPPLPSLEIHFRPILPYSWLEHDL